MNKKVLFEFLKKRNKQSERILSNNFIKKRNLSNDELIYISYKQYKNWKNPNSKSVLCELVGTSDVYHQLNNWTDMTGMGSYCANMIPYNNTKIIIYQEGNKQIMIGIKPIVPKPPYTKPINIYQAYCKFYMRQLIKHDKNTINKLNYLSISEKTLVDVITTVTSAQNKIFHVLTKETENIYIKTSVLDEIIVDWDYLNFLAENWERYLIKTLGPWK